MVIITRYMCLGPRIRNLVSWPGTTGFLPAQGKSAESLEL